jgi:DNA-binding response OmpR family regulator
VTLRLSLELALANMAEVNGCEVRLGSKMARLLEVLVLRGPHWSDWALLTEALWPDPDTQPLAAHALIRRAVGRLRKLGVEIETWHGVGLRLA